MALVVLFVVIAVVAVVVGAIAAAKRREEMAAYAAQHGWTYVADDSSLVDRWDGEPFGRGFGRRAFNVVTGTHDGRPFTSFDYEYKTQQSNGKTTTTVNHPYSVLAMSTTLAMPALSVDPEGLFDALADAVSGGTIDLESEDFNRSFSVRCPDRKFASDVLHPQMMEFLLQHRDVGFRVQRDTLLVVTNGKRTTGEIDASLAYVDGVIDRVPEFVWEQLRSHG